MTELKMKSQHDDQYQKPPKYYNQQDTAQCACASIITSSVYEKLPDF